MGSAPVGLNIDLPFEYSNEFIDDDKDINFDYFFVEKLCLWNTCKLL